MRFAAGTRQPLKRSRARGCGAMTSMRSAISKPGVPASTMKALMPREPRLGAGDGLDPAPAPGEEAEAADAAGAPVAPSPLRAKTT
jgi:hypothetical protein